MQKTVTLAAGLFLGGCMVQPTPVHSTSAPVRSAPQSPLAAVVLLGNLLSEREPNEAIRSDTRNTKKTSVQGWRDRVQLSMPDGSNVSCRFRDTPGVQAVMKGGGFYRRVSLTVNCDGGRQFEAVWVAGTGREMKTGIAAATRIADVWNQLAAPPSGSPTFQEEAAKYRDAATKPELPESAREFKVRAENAVAEKRFLDAIESFDRGLQIAPWWPQGHYNVALVLAELNEYGLATDEMQSYLALVPDAPNARTAQDKIYAWREHLERNAR